MPVPSSSYRPSQRSGDWTFITVTYNSVVQLRESWEGVDLGEHRWIVVDNNSSDGSAELAEELGAEVIRRTENLGFSSSNNLGLEHATSDWIAFVNPDLTPRLDSLTRIANLADRHSALVAPQLVNQDGSLQPNARGFPTPVQKIVNRGIPLPFVKSRRYTQTNFVEPTFIAWAMGAALCGRRELFESIGGWDSRYFIYYEDHDIGLRSWTVGHPVILDPASKWVHSWQRETTGFRFSPWRRELRSAARFYRRYPEFLLPKRWYERGRFGRLASVLWRQVETKDSGG